MSVFVVPNLPPPPNPPQLAGPALSVWALTVAYARDYGLRRLPIAGPKNSSPACQFVRTRAPQCTKVIKWIAQGFGGKPQLPSSDTTSPNEVLLEDMIGLPVHGQSPDGQLIVTVYGEYHYGLQVAPTATDQLTGGSAPYQPYPNVVAYNLSPADFNRIYTGPSTPPGGFGGGLINY